ncbi:MAG TPA: tRNA (adenosine(37)-N6)-threonylcarbamoyltransferase complex transferase subunit TsaD [Myxococcota bacterium]|nr:tRNA (adenosine(37)-N6)-threonylcarbamoyltransferase complex transferase subunit TsaD [Myxococcota bacterium]HRY95194.1 tRNA (adenosine(37)-N6)-threonylcarbamoyltransferase complex transferase subunit TsaD [Myxococcota bacterium]HSA20419.1 tRNA (adenosine(37)-N6)-threonylcarbamoyltransferase complex transferase subunit TsaD [Myxococcota bacterium]
MRVLGIESSCDECAAAVVVDGALRGQRVASQIAIHARYGGVVPELASRDHIRKVVAVVQAALAESGLRLEDLDGLGVTAGPGLIGSLLVGVCAAKTLAWTLRKPLVGVHHLEAHLRAVYLEAPSFAYPHLGLVVSGGHTSLVRVEGVGRVRLLGRTLDDAAGEALDKVAKLLGLGYPGGVSIQRTAEGGDPQALRFPRPLPGKRLDFSFSGLKTSAAVRLKREGRPTGQALRDFAASFQEAVVDSLVKKTLLAARVEGLERVLVAGGVAANSRLREKLGAAAARQGVEVVFPSVALCGDNAAMVAALAEVYLAAGRDDGPGLDADAGLAW